MNLQEYIYRQISKKITATNSDGLIKCLPPAQDKFVPSPNIYAPKFCIFYYILCHPDSFTARDSTIGLVGRRAGAFFLLGTETISS